MTHVSPVNEDSGDKRRRYRQGFENLDLHRRWRCPCDAMCNRTLPLTLAGSFVQKWRV